MSEGQPEDRRTRILEVDGDRVGFKIELVGAVASVGEGGRIPAPRALLIAEASRDARQLAILPLARVREAARRVLLCIPSRLFVHE